MRCPAAVLVLLAVLAQAGASEPASRDPLHGLPVLAKPQPRSEPLAQGDELSPGLRRLRDQHVILDGKVIIDRGPVDGLEVLACLRDGKTHEALIRLDTTHGQLVKAACIEALGLTRDGEPSDENSGLPARGTPVRLEVGWIDEDGKPQRIAASCLIRDRITDKAYPPLPYVYTGSRFLTIRGTDPQGQPVTRQQFMLDSTGSVAVNYDEPDALLASPFPGAAIDARFEANTAVSPVAGTVVQLIIRPWTAPLTLDLDETGALRAAGRILDDAAVVGLLAATYGPAASPDLRAVAVRVAASTPRSVDQAARARLIAVAAQAQAWVIPVFVLGD
jgi:hypothetical protein